MNMGVCLNKVIISKKNKRCYVFGMGKKFYKVMLTSACRLCEKKVKQKKNNEAPLEFTCQNCTKLRTSTSK